MQHIDSLLETVLYAEDLSAAERFYTDVMGFECVSGGSGLMVAMRVAPGSVLLVFDPRMSGAAGRTVPAHGGLGPGHVALRINKSAYGGWLVRLAEFGVEIEQEHVWENGARSIYVRDPAGNSVELITGDIWA